MTINTSKTLVILAVAVVWLIGQANVAPAASLYVDKQDPQCSNTGSGSQSIPFCTIKAGTSVAVAGDTVIVASGNYPEEVTFKNSGEFNAPIIATAANGANVTVGAGQRNGFRIASRSYITVKGFTVSGTTSYGMYLGYSSNITISDNHVTRSGRPVSGLNRQGIYFTNTTDSTVAGNLVDYNSDSGIYLASGTTRVLVYGNTTTNNAQVFSRAASGIDVRYSRNTIEANISYDNEDSGIQMRTGATNNLVINNLCYSNGDHGIDALGAGGQRILFNTVYNNVTAGINVEGGSTNSTVANNISVDNGIDSPRTEGNIRVDAKSISGTTIDYDIVYLSRSNEIMIVWGSKRYTSLAAFVNAVPGMETAGLELYPNWVDPISADFHLRPDSPAIDSADSGVSGAPGRDLESNPRVDDPGTPNSGAGSRTYYDRGAFEYQPA